MDNLTVAAVTAGLVVVFSVPIEGSPINDAIRSVYLHEDLTLSQWLLVSERYFVRFCY